MPAHIQLAPPAMSETEYATACWEDDGGPPFEPSPAAHATQWRRVAAELSGRLPDIADRHDVIVTCEHGTRSGAPAAFYPTTGIIEIDTKLFAPLAPATLHPARFGDEERYPIAWGVLIHEAAHAAHTAWLPAPHLRPTAAHQAAEMLEESRAECAHLARRPADRRFLRATVATLVMADITAQTPADRWQAAFAAGLILARRDAGILDEDETEALEHTVRDILGPDLLNTLAAIWQAAHQTADTDGQAMWEHGRAWCEALGTDPTQPPPAPGNERRGALAAAIGKVTGQVTANEDAHAAAQQEARTTRANRAKAKAAQAERQRQATRTAEHVFTPGARPYAPAPLRGSGRLASPITGTRLPTSAEKAATAHLARGLRAAAYRERTEITSTSAVPPGRLNMRGALARQAQQAAGATPTAQPWIHTQRRPIPAPPLRVGIAVDVSRSMRSAAAPIASAAWILAKATALTDPDSRAATVAYEESLTAITAPGRTPHRVTEFDADGAGHSLGHAIDALTAGLELTRPGRGRLLVIASDGYYRRTEAAEATERLTTLTQTGCAVLWLAFAPEPCPLPHTTLLELEDPAKAATAIAKAATTALQAL
ncbi:VWA domain-containing protein [Streptomyces monticola]|uniref:VWA domain-containing protein n=1 Tax=Streptomyces monticola TaxID=2666263 RepID=A0ABW2JHC0_9ACTN